MWYFIFSGPRNDTSEKSRRVFFDDKNNVAIDIFDKHFSLLSKGIKGNKLIVVHFPKKIKYSLKSLGDFAILSDKGDTLYTSASVEDGDGYGFSAILSINARNVVVNKNLLPYLNGIKYEINNFIFLMMDVRLQPFLREE